MLATVILSLLAQSPTTVYSTSRDRVVLVVTSEGSGSAFYVGPDRHHGWWFLTNRHVVGDASIIAIVTGDDKNVAVTPVRSALVDAAADLALLRVDDSSWSKVTPLSFRANSLEVDDEISAIGYPYGLTDKIRELPEPTFTRGKILEGNLQGFIISSMRVNPGNSGGPALDSQGNVAGVVTAKFIEDNHSILTTVDEVQKFAKAAGVTITLKTSQRARAERPPVSSPAPVLAPGVVSVSFPGLTGYAVLLHPATMSSISYILIPFSELVLRPRIGGEVQLSVSNDNRTLSTVGRFAAAQDDLVVIETPRIAEMEGATLGTFDTTVGEQLWTKLFLQRPSRRDDLGFQSLMVSRVESTARSGTMVRLDLESSRFGLAQGVAVKNGKVVGISVARQEARGTVEVSPVLQKSALMARLHGGSLKVISRGHSNCALELKGELVDPLGQTRRLELRLSPPGITMQTFQGEVQGAVATAEVVGNSVSLESVAEPCRQLRDRAVQVVLRAEANSRSLFSFATAVPPQGTPMPLLVTWVTALELPPGSSVQSGTRPTAPNELATPDGQLGTSTIDGENVLTLNGLPLRPTCETARIRPSRWPRLGVSCPFGSVEGSRSFDTKTAEHLAFDGAGDVLVRLQWNHLGILRDGRISEFPIQEQAALEDPRFVRALADGFLIVTGGPRPTVSQVGWHRSRRTLGSLGATPGAAKGLDDRGQLVNRTLPDLAEGPIGAPSPNPGANYEGVALLDGDTASCRKSKLPLPGDAHFAAFGVVLSVGADITPFFHSAISAPGLSIDELGQPVVPGFGEAATRLLSADVFRPFRGQCTRVGAGLSEALSQSQESLYDFPGGHGLTLKRNPPTLEGGGVSTSLGFLGTVLMARWVKDRFLVLARIGANTLSLWHVSELTLRQVGTFPKLSAPSPILSLDETGQVHLVTADSVPELWSATAGGKAWKRRKLPFSERDRFMPVAHEAAR